MRLDKFISEMGLASRKEASLLAKRGQILVDGAPERDASRHIDPERQSISFMGREVLYRKYTYVMLNKPEGYVSATEDSRLPVVTELLPAQLRKQELFPVGRLDKDTVGLMILTNNGQLAHTLLSPRRHVEKEYIFECAEPLPIGAKDAFRDGITLGDGYECKPSELRCSEGRMGGRIVLTEDKYHQIKRMIASFNNRVTRLERVRFADVPLDGSLPRGEWRYLTDGEIRLLEERAK